MCENGEFWIEKIHIKFLSFHWEPPHYLAAAIPALILQHFDESLVNKLCRIQGYDLITLDNFEIRTWGQY